METTEDENNVKLKVEQTNNEINWSIKKRVTFIITIGLNESNIIFL